MLIVLDDTQVRQFSYYYFISLIAFTLLRLLSMIDCRQSFINTYRSIEPIKLQCTVHGLWALYTQNLRRKVER